MPHSTKGPGPRLSLCPLSFRELGMPETHFPRMSLLGFSVDRGYPTLDTSFWAGHF